MVTFRGFNSLFTTVSSGESIRWFRVVVRLFLLLTSRCPSHHGHHASFILILAVIIQDAPWDLRLVKFGCSFEVSFLTATGRTAGFAVIWRIFLRNITSFFRLDWRLTVHLLDPACRHISKLLACIEGSPCSSINIQPELLQFALGTGQISFIILRWRQH